MIQTFQSVGNWWLQATDRNFRADDVSNASLTSLDVNLHNKSEVRPLNCTDRLSDVPNCSIASNVATHALPQTIQSVLPRLKGEGQSTTRMSSAARFTPYTKSHFLS
ncbi:hypothetical protein DPMN_082488 [Dreissena polymorpha]|uniref:Uncharacterized protein n=1 Tax=Dreissena polymorpha TaxID=45954 RepID=A0A9D3YAY4_DREPO|nr:hypothetical protein DPMN_082488 [Dreissena polymorpha]